LNVTAPVRVLSRVGRSLAFPQHHAVARPLGRGRSILGLPSFYQWIKDCIMDQCIKADEYICSRQARFLELKQLHGQRNALAMYRAEFGSVAPKAWRGLSTLQTNDNQGDSNE
jgi:hypothetical protein